MKTTRLLQGLFAGSLCLLGWHSLGTLARAQVVEEDVELIEDEVEADDVAQPVQAAAVGQLQVQIGVAGAALPAPKPADDAKKGDAVPAEPQPAAESPKPMVDPEVLRLDLMDGSGISGKLSVKDITIETQYGTLTIPVTEIKTFTPGLDSYPQVNEQVGKLIQQLGSEDYNEREQAHKELARMGLQVKGELQKHVQDEDAERVRHVKAILTEFEQIVDADDEDAPHKSAWIRDDTIETVHFTVVGKISPKQFEISSKYGPLTIALSDIRQGRRDVGVKEEVRKSLSVEGMHLVQRSFKNSNIRVEKGDKVSVSAEGMIVMSPWGNDAMSTPDGGENYGWYIPNQILGGALVGKIGDGGPVFKIGSKNIFVADRPGVLQFAVAMQAQYARNNFQFPGKYDLKIKIEPKP